MIIEQISVFLENRAGQLAEITGILADKGIDLQAINIAETADYGVLRMVTDDTAAALAALTEQGFVVKKNHVVAVSVPDRPGGLHTLLDAAAGANIDITYMYSVFGKIDGKARMVLRTENNEALEALLTREGFEI